MGTPWKSPALWGRRHPIGVGEDLAGASATRRTSAWIRDPRRLSDVSEAVPPAPIAQRPPLRFRRQIPGGRRRLGAMRH